MNKAYLLSLLLLAGGVTGYISSDDKDERLDIKNVEEVYNTTTKFALDLFNTAMYGSICGSLMYEDGTFYRGVDVSDCENKAEDEYTGSSSSTKSDAVIAPDWKYREFTNTGKRAEFTDDIYQISEIGLYCERYNGNCEAIKISEMYMAKNTESGLWGYASQGFMTTDGAYLKVIDDGDF